jgi:hypothetical protein
MRRNNAFMDAITVPSTAVLKERIDLLRRELVAVKKLYRLAHAAETSQQLEASREQMPSTTHQGKGSR